MRRQGGAGSARGPRGEARTVPPAFGEQREGAGAEEEEAEDGARMALAG